MLKALPLFLKRKERGILRLLAVKNRDARFYQACPDSSEFSGLDKNSLPKPDIPTGGRLFHFRKAWEKITTDKWTQSVIRNGYKIQFRVQPRLSRVVPPFLRATPKDPAQILLLKAEVQSMLDKHAIEPVSPLHPKSGYYSRLFLVRKKSGGWRPVIDLSRLNRHVITPHFKMETLDSVRLSLRRNDWAISLDLSDAYFHIPIHRKSRRYLRFHFMGKTYQFRALPFGLAPAPYAFSRVVKAVVKHCRHMGMRLHSYLDDWLQPSQSRSLSLFHREQLLDTVLSLGFVPNWIKSELVPSQNLYFLGARFCLEEGLIGPSLDRITRLETLIQKMLSARSASARQIHSLLGQMESMAHLLPDGRAHKGLLQWHIKDRWSQADQSWDFHISLGPFAPFVLLSVSILGWFTNIYPTRPRKQRIKVKFVKPVKTTIGTKSVLGYGQQTVTEP